MKKIQEKDDKILRLESILETHPSDNQFKTDFQSQNQPKIQKLTNQSDFNLNRQQQSQDNLEL